jgi:hypothetical protein
MKTQGYLSSDIWKSPLRFPVREMVSEEAVTLPAYHELHRPNAACLSIYLGCAFRQLRLGDAYTAYTTTQGAIHHIQGKRIPTMWVGATFLVVSSGSDSWTYTKYVRTMTWKDRSPWHVGINVVRR